MRPFVMALVGCLAGSGSLMALVPGITSVQNPASNTLPGLPNYGIAQGSIFVLYGSQLGPSTISIAPTLPFQTVLAGTSIKVTAGGLTFNPYIIYTLSSQVAAVMPSNTVVGPATIQVTYNGFTSPAFSTTIVQNNFGISTVNQTGNATAVLTYPTSTSPFYAVVSGTNSAIPGNTYTMWGTGLGPAAGGNSDDNVNVFASVGPAPAVLVGGVAANVVYYGRSPGAGPGLDQINFTIPAGLSGCNVSLVVQTTSTPATLSNGTTIPISSNGGACSDTFGIPPSTWQPLISLSGGVNTSYFVMSQSSSTTYSQQGAANPTVTSSLASAFFTHYTQAQLTSQYQGLFSPTASIGSCVMGVTLVGGGTSSINATALDAGANVTLNSFTGQVYQLGKQTSGGYFVGGSVPFPTGAYTLTDGTGGAGVGPIGSIGMTVPVYATWTNQTALGGTKITRANGQTVTWTGGNTASGGYIDIVGSAGFGAGNADTISFECAVLPSAGQFTIPASVLLAMPIGSGSLQISDRVAQTASVPAMNLAVTETDNVSSVGVDWN